MDRKSPNKPTFDRFSELNFVEFPIKLSGIIARIKLDTLRISNKKIYFNINLLKWASRTKCDIKLIYTILVENYILLDFDGVLFIEHHEA